MDPQLEQIIQQMIAEGAPEEAIAAVVQTYQEPQGGVLSRGAGGFFNRLKELGAGAVEGVTTALTQNPLTTVGNIYEGAVQASADQFGKALNAPTWSEAAGHGAAGMLPFIGPAAAKVGEDLGSGDAGRVGAGLADATTMAIPGMPKAARAAGRGVKTAVRPLHPLAKRVSGALENETVGDLIKAGGVSGTGLAAARGLARAADNFSAPPKPMTPGLDRMMPNRSNPRAGAVNAADEIDPIARTESGLDPYMPNRSGRREGLPAEFMTPDDEAAFNSLRQSTYGGAVDPADVLPSGMPTRSGSNYQRPSTFSSRERLTRELNDADMVTDAADREWQTAHPALPRNGNGGSGESIRGLELADDIDVPQSLPAMSEVDELIGSMNPNVPHSRRMGRANRIVERDVSNHQRKRRHGVAGFRNLPELPPGELDRISKIIAGIEARRGGE